MADSPTIAGKPNQRPRPWYRLHLSTVLVLLLATAILLLLVVPGSSDSVEKSIAWLREEEGFVLAYSGGTFEHGWPWMYLRRSRLDLFQPYFGGNPAWMRKEGWSFHGDNLEFHVSLLALDLLVAVSLLLAVAALFEWWRRRRSRVWQFTIRDMLVVTLMLAAGLGWWQMHRRRFHRETHVFSLERPSSLLAMTHGSIVARSGC